MKKTKEFAPAAVFSSNMVLQRRKNINIFGEGADGDRVTVTLGGECTDTIIRDGRFLAVLNPQEAADSIVLKLECYSGKSGRLKKTVVFENVAIGEVWLCGGQSNMEFELQNCTGGMESLKNDRNPNVRFYYTNKIAVKDSNFYEAEKNTCWNLFSSTNAKAWSAVGYYFGKKLSEDLGITVGLIGCNWGGTSASAWMSENALAEDKDTKTYLDEYYDAIRGKTKEVQLKEFAEYEAFHAQWSKKCEELYRKNPDITWDEVQEILGKCRWPGPMNCANPFRPSGLYDTMLKRVMPYTLAGFIYYQGESDDHKPLFYEKLFTRMIRNWREDWEDNKLPFLFVQLPPHRYKQDPDRKNWAYIREAQQHVFDTVRNTQMAVIMDKGQYNDIHPKEKLTPGSRLAGLAEYSVYGMLGEKKVYGPMYDHMAIEEKDSGSIRSVKLFFRNADDGIVVKFPDSGFEYLDYDSKKVERAIKECEGDIYLEAKYSPFEIAGDDKIFFPADMQIIGNTIKVSNNDVKRPLYVRYMFSNYGPCLLYARNGLPMAPFRTSVRDEKNILENEKKEIKQLMEL